MTNRTALITGASRGIGRACALALSEAGARVALAARNVEQLEELAGQIRGTGREAFVVPLQCWAELPVPTVKVTVCPDSGVPPVVVRTADRFGALPLVTEVLPV